MQIFKLVDIAYANILNVSVKTYTEKIEKTTYKRAGLIIEAICSEDPKSIEKAKRIFNLIN